MIRDETRAPDLRPTDPRSEEIHTGDGRIIEPDNRQQPPPREAAPGPQVLTADTVRSGPPGRPVLLVLGFSLGAIVVLFGLYYMFWSASLP